jgi:hypothetical protein
VDIVRFELASVHELHDHEKRLFLVVHDVCTLPKEDEVLEVPQLRILRSWRVIGLPVVLPKRLWVVDRMQRSLFDIIDVEYDWDNFQANASLDEGEYQGLLLCPWDISFM